MTALAEYLLKANLCLAGFYALYYLLLRRHTFFTLNRIYLLAALGLSFGLPLISLPEPVVETVSLPMISLPVVAVAAQPTGPTTEEILLAMYGLGTLLFLTLLVISLWRLMQLIHSGTATRQSDHTLVLLPDERVAPFSFFRYLVLNTTDFTQHADPILRHELAHIRQWHSVDVLLGELVKVVCWPNPVAWLYKRSLQQVHEYLADQQAADKEQYARFLFDYAFAGSTSPVANSFFTPAMLTQRIRMLYQSRNTKRVLWKYTLAVPLLVLLVGLTAARERIAEIIPAHNQPAVANLTITGHVYSGTKNGTAPLPGAHVIIRNANRGTDTDANGYFELKDVPATATLVISYVGRKTIEIPVKKTKNLVVLLGSETTKLPEMTVSDMPREQRLGDETPPASTTTPSNEIFTVVEQAPEFPGGLSALQNYLASNLRYPAEAQQNRTQGRVFVQFVVTADGSIEAAKVLKGIGNGCNEEAVRVVSAMPKWNPGKQNGRPVNVQFNLPINFKLAGGKSMTVLPGEKPLVFIDGVEQDKNFDLNTIKPNEIQSINVLKGGTAETYGEKGKNGVILIITKAKKP